MIEDAIKYQFQDDEWVGRVLIGGVVLFLGFLLVPLFTFQGYMLEVMRRVMRGDTANPPEWGDLDLADLTVDGLRYMVVALGYGLVVALIAGVPFAFLLFVGVLGESGGMTLFAILVGFGLYFVASLAMAVVLPVATANFVREDSIVAGFDFAVLRTVVPNRTMLLAIVMAFAVNILMSVVASLLGITIVGYLAVPFLAFVGQSAIMYIWAEGFADAYEETFGDSLRSGSAGTGAGGSPSTSGPGGTTGWDTDDTGDTAAETFDSGAGHSTGAGADDTAGWDDDSDVDTAWDDAGGDEDRL